MPAGQRGCQFLSHLRFERLLLISHALKRLLLISAYASNERLFKIHNSYLPFGSNDYYLSRFRSNDCYKVSKFHASKMLVLRVFKVLKVLKVLRVLKVLKVSASTHRKSGGTSCPNLGTQNKRLLIVYFGKAEVRVAFNDRAERYHSRNLVTERGVIGQCNLVTERASKANFQNS